MIVKDVTLGILIIVLSLFPYKLAEYFVQPKEWWTMPAVFLLLMFFSFVFDIGWKLIFTGIKVDDVEK